MDKKTFVIFSLACLMSLNVSLAHAGDEAARATPQVLSESTSKAANVEEKSDVQAAQDLHQVGLDFFEKQLYEESLAKYEEVIARFGEASEPEVGTEVVRAMNSKALVLCKMERLQEAIAVYDALIVRLSNASEPEMHEQLAWAMLSPIFSQKQANLV